MRTRIIYEDDVLLVIDKPAGLATQSARVTQQDVYSELTNYLHGGYVGLVHRLDQPVEGLLVVARTKQAAAFLAAQLGSGKLTKEYLAVVHLLAPGSASAEGAGERPQERQGIGTVITLTDYMRKNNQTGRVEILDVTGKSLPAGTQKAILSYRIVEEKSPLALVCVSLQTGRFHQIRAQMAHAGMPLLGDQKYAPEETKQLCAQHQVKHVALCANRLSLTHPVTKQTMHFEKKPDGAIFHTFSCLQEENATFISDEMCPE